MPMLLLILADCAVHGTATRWLLLAVGDALGWSCRCRLVPLAAERMVEGQLGLGREQRELFQKTETLGHGSNTRTRG